MANEEHLKILKQGAWQWNKWRLENDSIRPVLGGADLSDADWGDADLSGANLSGAIQRCSCHTRTGERSTTAC